LRAGALARSRPGLDAIRGCNAAHTAWGYCDTYC
jgi:hypothetical protein